MCARALALALALPLWFVLSSPPSSYTFSWCYLSFFRLGMLIYCVPDNIMREAMLVVMFARGPQQVTGGADHPAFWR
jgi:hypothetical protein